MTKKLLNQLIEYSYRDNIVSPENVNKVVGYLNRSDFKQYIKRLKMYEKKHSVFIDLPSDNYDLKGKFKEIFPNKKIVLGVDNTLMLGLRIIDDDMLFEMNLKSNLKRILSYIEEDYD